VRDVQRQLSPRLDAPPGGDALLPLPGLPVPRDRVRGDVQLDHGSAGSGVPALDPRCPPVHRDAGVIDRHVLLPPRGTGPHPTTRAGAPVITCLLAVVAADQVPRRPEIGQRGGSAPSAAGAHLRRRRRRARDPVVLVLLSALVTRLLLLAHRSSPPDR